MNTHSVTIKQSASTTRYQKVLLIDDNSMDNLINKKLLANAQFAADIFAHESAIETLAYLKNEAIEHLPELIFLDINMPGMDGFQFLDEFAKLSVEIHKKCKIIMLSSSDSFKDLNRANKNPFVKKFLNKPLTTPILNAIQI